MTPQHPAAQGRLTPNEQMTVGRALQWLRGGKEPGPVRRPAPGHTPMPRSKAARLRLQRLRELGLAQRRAQQRQRQEEEERRGWEAEHVERVERARMLQYRGRGGKR